MNVAGPNDDPPVTPEPEAAPAPPQDEPVSDPSPEISAESAHAPEHSSNLYAWPQALQPLASMEAIPAPLPPPPRLIPNIGHALAFFFLFVPALIFGAILSFVGALVFLHPGNPRAMLGTIAHNVTFAIVMQAVSYGIVWGLAALIFSLWWRRPFAQGIHWNLATARRWFFRLLFIGVATGLLITLAGSFVPMPKAPPILEDLTKSQLGAWMLMVFGITIAPLTEELAFRGFLLPGLVNIFRWLERKQMIGETATRTFGIPLAIVLTSIPFALLHAQQVSDSWGPVLLIGLVSVVLCIVRLRTNSVACGIVVHAAYNSTLFVSLLFQTDAFRHLTRLKS